MKKIIATEQVLSPLGHRTAVKYHYEDGSSRVVQKDENKDNSNVLKDIIDRCNRDNLADDR